MKIIKKSTVITLALFVYVSLSAGYFLPRNTVISNTEKYLTVVISYIIVAIIWLVLIKKERRQQKRRERKKKE